MERRDIEERPKGLSDTEGKLCSECLKFGLETPAEKYGKVLLYECTFHHWLKRGREQGYSLESYTQSSGKRGFATSLPSDEHMARMVPL
jgi:hypothetical protein